jgi:exopolysaccharide biosynthesis polyprenyl glycosylphosphotransferase
VNQKTFSASPPIKPQDIRRIPTIAELRRGILFSWLRRIILLVTDIVMLSLAWDLARSFGTPTGSFLNNANLAITLFPVLCISISIFAARQLYHSGESRRDYLALVKAQSLAVILLVLLSYFYNPEKFVSRSQFIIYWGLSIIFLCVGRFIIDFMVSRLRKRGSMRYLAVVIAPLDQQEKVINVVRHEGRYRLASILDTQTLNRDRREATFQQLQRLGVSEVFVAWDAIKKRMFLGQRFQSLGLTLRVVPSGEKEIFSNAKLHMLNDDMPCITFSPPDVTGISFWIKRFFDFVFAVLVVTLAFPLYLGIAIAIYLDSSGPIFYRQTRIGLHGIPFKVWKFRSMITDADKLQARLEARNKTSDGVLFKVENDPRITRVGQFIRQYSLDELPQLFNVLLGEMSFVGPRPLPLRDVEKFKQNHFIRQDVLPGITGMWQVSGRSDINNFEDVMKLDTYYIQHWSLWLDLKILFQTFAAVIQKSGAY